MPHQQKTSLPCRRAPVKCCHLLSPWGVSAGYLRQPLNQAPPPIYVRAHDKIMTTTPQKTPNLSGKGSSQVQNQQLSSSVINFQCIWVKCDPYETDQFVLRPEVQPDHLYIKTTSVKPHWHVMIVTTPTYVSSSGGVVSSHVHLGLMNHV